MECGIAAELVEFGRYRSTTFLYALAIMISPREIDSN